MSPEPVAIEGLGSRTPVEFQAFGGIIDEGQEIRMRSLPPGMTCRHRGDVDDPDFNNMHVEIVWP